MGNPADPVSPALERVVGRFERSVREVARRHGLDAAALDEVLQDVRIRLWRALGSGERIEGAPASYVYRTAVSAALDLIRRRRARREVALPEAALGAAGPLVSGHAAEREAEANELGEQVWRALDGIVASRRPVVRMYLAGYGVEEIARLLGWSEPKTRNLVYRGMAELRVRLGEAGVGPGEGGE
jgi:RNA polymerase sigma-70 factor (ECF subfamily)